MMSQRRRADDQGAYEPDKYEAAVKNRHSARWLEIQYPQYRGNAEEGQNV